MIEYESDQIDVVEWRRRVREALIQVEATVRDLENKLQATHDQLRVKAEERDRLEMEEQLIAHAIDLYINRLNASHKRVEIAGDTLREVIAINFADPEGVVKGREAVMALLDIGYFSSRKTADGAVYSTLAKPPFVKLDKGIYRIPTDSVDWLRLRGTNGHRPLESQNGGQKPSNTDSPRVSFQEKVDAVVAAALQHGGAIRAYEATKVLERARLYNNPKTIGLQTLQVLTKSGKSGRFNKTKRGHYYLKD